jgi:Flp pilus assembly pilin Flp
MGRFRARLFREDSGQNLTEYALLLVLIVLAVAAVLPVFSNSLASVYQDKAEEVECHANAQGDPARACTEDRGPRDPQN